MSKNSCLKCGAKKHTKLAPPVTRDGTIPDKVQRVRCDKCGQVRFNVLKPRKTKETKDGSHSNSIPADS